MKRSLLILAAVFIVTNVWAQDPWKKSYKNWDTQDVRKILNDSPWSRPVEVERKEKKKLSLDAPAGAPTVAGVRKEEDEDEDEEEEQKGKDDRRERSEKGKKKDDLKFLVRWVSSRTLREASVRGQVLQGKIAEADTDKNLPPAADDYELVLVGSDMSSFRNRDEYALRSKTYLVAKKSKERIMASQVEFVPSADGKKINAVVFHFPKNNPAGQPLASADERELNFVSYAGNVEINVSFNPQKMVDEHGMDL